MGTDFFVQEFTRCSGEMDKLEHLLPTNYSVSSGGRFRSGKNECRDCRVKADREESMQKWSGPVEVRGSIPPVI